MRARLLPAAAAAVLGLSACGTDTTSPGATSTPSSSGTSPAATAAPTPAPAPADETDPPAPTAPTAPTRPTGPPRVVGTVASGLEAPWGLAFLPGGDAVLTERDSTRVLLVSGGGTGTGAAASGRVSEIGTVGVAAPAGEGGLLGVAVSPTYDADRLLYFYATTAEDNRVLRARLDGDRLGRLRPVLTGIPRGSTHDGGRLLFDAEGMLLVSTGEAGEPERAQDPDDLGGKILRITPDGDPAPGNPSGTAVLSLGHRNVQGLALTDDGALWASELGDQTSDELNRIEPGANYGWPEVEGRGGADRGYVDPERQWATDDNSPSGLAAAAGSLWMGALRGERLWRVPLTAEGTGRPRGFSLGDVGRVRTVVTAPDGRLWVTTSNTDGRGDPGPDDDRVLLVEP